MKTINLEDFHDIEIKIEFEKIMDKYAERAKRKLMQHPPTPASNRPNRVTPYRLGWEVNHEKLKHGYRDVVWNKTNWQLTHLLENGHFITNIKGGLKWVEPRKHIRPAFEEVKSSYIKAMQKAKLKVNIK